MKTSRAPRMVLGRSLPPLQHLTSPDLPCFELTYLSNGRTFKALAHGRNAQAAAHEGLIALAQQCPEFDSDTVRLVGAVQTR